MKCLTLLALWLVCSCSPHRAYVDADRATFDVIAPAYLAYVRGDASLDQLQVQRRARLVDTWRIRIERAEAAGR